MLWCNTLCFVRFLRFIGTHLFVIILMMVFLIITTVSGPATLQVCAGYILFFTVRTLRCAHDMIVVLGFFCRACSCF